MSEIKQIIYPCGCKVEQSTSPQHAEFFARHGFTYSATRWCAEHAPREEQKEEKP